VVNHTTPTQYPTPKRFRCYALPEVLYSDQRLILNLEDRIVTLVGGHGELEAQACFPAAALAVTRALLDAHPAPCALDARYAAFASVERIAAREILAALEQASVLDLALHGLDVALADCRAQLAAFNLGMQPVPEEGGYRLFRLSLP
jgi:glyoxylase-like metal-dependent hydrolase (beta-lactamase superfamily II)